MDVIAVASMPLLGIFESPENTEIMNTILATLLIPSGLALAWVGLNHIIHLPPPAESTHRIKFVPPTLQLGPLPAPLPEKPAESPEKEETTADRIQALADTWERQKQFTAECHQQQAKGNFQIIYGLLQHIGKESVTFQRESPDDVMIYINADHDDENKVTVGWKRR